MGFTLCAGTRIGKYRGGDCPEAVENAAKLLRRDLKKRFGESEAAVNEIELANADAGRPEGFRIAVSGGRMAVCASDALGFVYGLLTVSEKFLGIRPFWFRMDQKIGKIAPVEAEDGS